MTNRIEDRQRPIQRLVLRIRTADLAVISATQMAACDPAQGHPILLSTDAPPLR